MHYLAERLPWRQRTSGVAGDFSEQAFLPIQRHSRPDWIQSQAACSSWPCFQLGG